MADAQVGEGAGAAQNTTVPYVTQDVQEIASLVRSLEAASKGGKGKHGFHIKKTKFSVAGSRDGIEVDSWRLQDWDYKRRDLPTYARGLFTTKGKRGTPEIAVRGYDKFFNVGEVFHTRWENVLTQTKGPYELSLKENGCIIFISGLEDGTLLVCSKHSTGDRSDVEVSHASAGEVRLEKQLEALGKTKQDLARELRKRNVTAVAELCDDSFEEHILAYGPEKAGLYLHGINVNLPEFMTYPGNLVQQFAKDWGFRETGLIVMDDIEKVKVFLEEVAETGAHDGRDVEGFVIRCKQTTDDGKSYQDWFFKYKFEEPYLMYRQWRECTKALIAGKSPKYKKHAKITEEYLLYARKRLAEDRSLGKAYNQNHGIIALRNDFLAFKQLKGSDAANFDELYGGSGVKTEVDRDIILVPIATIGCGKTTIALALTKLFGWGHIQNDNIAGSKRPPRFTKAVLDQLDEQPAVFADRNNAQRHERKQLINDVKLQHARARLVALNFVHDDLSEVRRVTRQRVFARGDNHQTIQAATDGDKVRGIMEGFINRFEPCDVEREPDSGFDSVIDLNPAAGSRQNLEIVVTELHRMYPNFLPNLPSAEEMDEATQAALDGYKPDLRHTIPDRSGGKARRDQKDRGQQQQQGPAKKKPLEYMGIDVPTKEVLTVLDRAFDSAHVAPATARFFRQLQQTRRVQPRFHVTLMHRATARERPDLWEHYVRLQADAEDAAERGGAFIPAALGSADILLERIVFDERIMAIVVRISEEGEGAAAVEGGGAKVTWECVNKVAHITVGTRDDAVKPKESNDLLARWLEVGSGGNTGITELACEGRPTVRGSVRGVLAR